MNVIISFKTITCSGVSGSLNFSECLHQCASTYCRSKTEDNCLMAKGPLLSNVNSARCTPNSAKQEI